LEEYDLAPLLTVLQREEVERLLMDFGGVNDQAVTKEQWEVIIPSEIFQRGKYQEITVINQIGSIVTLHNDITKKTKKEPSLMKPTHVLNIIPERYDGTMLSGCEKCHDFLEASESHTKSNDGFYHFKVRIICGHTHGRKRKENDEIFLKFQLTVCEDSESNNNNNRNVILDLGRKQIGFCATRGSKPPDNRNLKILKFHHTFSVTRFLNRILSWVLF
jgi:hypothetical protein